MVSTSITHEHQWNVTKNNTYIHIWDSLEVSLIIAAIKDENLLI